MKKVGKVKVESASTIYRDTWQAQGKSQTRCSCWKGAADGIVIGFLLGEPLLGEAVGYAAGC
jgi:uncharacterized membrane protein